MTDLLSTDFIQLRNTEMQFITRGKSKDSVSKQNHGVLRSIIMAGLILSSV